LFVYTHLVRISNISRVEALGTRLRQVYPKLCTGDVLNLCDCQYQTTRRLTVTLKDLNLEIKHCQKCGLWLCSKNVVIGEGPTNARVMLVGQNPGAEEDKTGRPFLGRAGKFLNVVLSENCINREKVFVTNIVKHTSPKNRKPLPTEIAACVPFLVAQIQLIKPKIVVLMGTIAWQTPRAEGIEYFETIHPSAAMRFTKMKKRFKEDFAKIGKRL
jgi:uracil-DNA glycosylase